MKKIVCVFLSHHSLTTGSDTTSGCADGGKTQRLAKGQKGGIAVYLFFCSIKQRTVDLQNQWIMTRANPYILMLGKLKVVA